MHTRHSLPALDLEHALGAAEPLSEAVWFMFDHMTKGQENPLTDAIMAALLELHSCIHDVRKASDALFALEKERGPLRAAA